MRDPGKKKAKLAICDDLGETTPVRYRILALSSIALSCGSHEPAITPPTPSAATHSDKSDSSNSTNSSVNGESSEHSASWTNDESLAFERARTEGKGVVIDFEASWCAPCRIMNELLSEPALFTALNEHFVPLRFDVTEATPEDEKRQNKYAANTLPALVFLDAQGQEIYRYANKQVDKASLEAGLLEATMLLRGK